jgi:hypothetical protein
MPDQWITDELLQAKKLRLLKGEYSDYRCNHVSSVFIRLSPVVGQDA